MQIGCDAPPPTIGFLTAVRDEQLGLMGGYLILNAQARPLEFHCTAPLKATRAQEILYGATLEPYLYGEQVGQSLLKAAAAAPLVVCTDLPAMLSVRPWVSTPVALVLSAARDDEYDQGEQWRFDPQQSASPHLKGFRLGRSRLAVELLRGEDQRTIAERLAPGGPIDVEWFDMLEPFERIRTALDEAQRGSR